MRAAALLALVAILPIAAACGGGGGGAERTATPAAVASPTPTTEEQYQIAYVDKDGRDVWVVPADGIGPRNVTAGGCPRPYPQLYWSPAGDRVACIATGSAAMPKTQIRVFDLDGRLLFELERDALFAGLSWPDMMEMSPSSLWSPTGQYLAFVVDEYLTRVAEGGPLQSTPHLFIAETEQGHIRKSVPGGQQPRWSADGSRIAYNKPPDDTLVVSDLTTGDEMVLGTGLRPLAWVLQDTSLLVAANIGIQPESSMRRTTYEANLLDLSSGEMTRVPELDGSAEFWLSPDGTKAVVLGSAPSLAALDLVTLRLTDIAGSVITYPSEYIPRQQLTFTPDSSRIYWFDGIETIYSAKTDGSDLTTVGPLPNVTFFLGFSPDATQVLYQASAGLWVAKVDGSDAQLVVSGAQLVVSGAARYAVWGPSASLAKPTAINGLRVLPLQFGEQMELPNNVALIIETGCYYCDGPTTGLYRLYRDGSGQLRTDALFTVEALGLPPLGVAHYKEGDQTLQPFIHSYALRSDASEIVVSVCTRGGCAWLGDASPDAQTTLYRSLDGGVTWEEFGTLDGQSWVVAIANDGVVVASPSHTEDNPQPTYHLFPSGEPVQPPSGASWWPLTLRGELVWRTEDGRLLRSDGSEFLALGEGTSVQDIVPDATGQRFAAAWYADLPSPRNLVGLFSRDGRPTSAFSLSDSARVGGWLRDTLVVGNVGVPSGLLPTPEPGGYAINFVPAVLDLEAGEAHPLAGPFHEQPLFGRNYVRAVLRGPFVRVVDTGSCLNVRAQPGMAAPVLACAADGVLLRDTGETRDTDGATWARVVTPAGVEGWASSQYLER